MQRVGSLFDADQLNILKVNTDEDEKLASAYRIQVHILSPGLY